MAKAQAQALPRPTERLAARRGPARGVASGRRMRITTVAALAASCAGLFGPGGDAQAAPRRKPRPPALRFSGRLQILSGAGLALPEDASGGKNFRAYVPMDVEFGLRLSGPLGLLLGGAGYLAPWNVSRCGDTQTERANALAAFLGLRLDLNNSRAGSWWSPWVALRAGVSGQSGVQVSDPCTHLGAGYVVGPYFAPRVGTDLWLGQAAVSFALGYDYLPRASAVTVQVGLTLRLF